MKNQQQGFTLIEIAIVLVIIGLLLGGVLKGQELITSARVRNMISQQDGIKAAYFGFLDRYRALPGDYSTATTNIKDTTANGDGNGQITDGGTNKESILVWEHLSRAGFINGSYTYNATQSDATTPKNPYAVYLQLIFDAAYGDSGTAQSKHNLKTGAQVPVEILAEVDRKIDDGNGLRGGFRFSQYQGNAATAPAAAAATGACINTTGDWQPTQSITNCGAASLF
ncbi:MAG: prepilin-type N-terminal cleavage/methylation domain-containing protein [Sulfuricella sp.]